MDLHGRGSGLTTVGPLGWLWLQQAHPSHDALGSQGLPRPQRPGRRAPSYAQQDFRRRVSASLSVSRTPSFHEIEMDLGPMEGTSFTQAKRMQWRR